MHTCRQPGIGYLLKCDSMTRYFLLLTLFYLPGASSAQWISSSPPGPDYCTWQTITYTYYPINPNNTINWYVDDYGPFSWSGTPASMYAGTGTTLTIPPFNYSPGIRVRVQETDINAVVIAEIYEYSVFQDFSPIPVYYSYSGCGTLTVADPYDGQVSMLRWSMWYRDGVPTGWTQGYLYGPLPGGTYHYKLVLGCSTDTLSTDPIPVNGFPEPLVTASGPTTFCDGDSVILTLQPGLSVWNWRKDGVGIPGTSGMTSLKVTTSGIYTVQAYTQGGGGGNCYQMSDPVTVTVNPAAIISGVAVGCSGDTVTLSCTAAASYQWKRNGFDMVGATSQTLSVTQGGNYRVITTGLTCDTSDLHTLQFYANPSSVSLSQSGTIPLCKYEALTLTVTGSNITSWNWLRNGVAMPGSNTPSITATKAGNYKCIVTNAIGCSKTTATAKLVTPVATDLPTKTVNIKPGPAGSDSYTTSDFGNWGTNFGNATSLEVSAWYKYFRTAERGYLKFDLSSIPEQSPIVSATLKLYADTAVVYQSGLQTLFVKRITESWLENTVTFYVAPDSTSFQFSSIPVTAAQSNSTVSVSVVDMVRHWSFVPAENYGLLLHLEEITTATIKAGWMSFYSGDHATAATRPKLTVKYSYADITENGPLSFCAGGSVTFSTNPGYSYQWYLNNNAIAGATAASYTATVAGDYDVMLSNAAGCSVKSATKTVTIPCREGNLIADDILIINEPNSEAIKVRLPLEEGTITVYNITGQRINTYDCRERECSFSKSNLASGMYVVHVVSGTVVKTGKFAVE